MFLGFYSPWTHLWSLLSWGGGPCGSYWHCAPLGDLRCFRVGGPLGPAVADTTPCNAQRKGTSKTSKGLRDSVYRAAWNHFFGGINQVSMSPSEGITVCTVTYCIQNRLWNNRRYIYRRKKHLHGPGCLPNSLRVLQGCARDCPFEGGEAGSKKRGAAGSHT